MKKQGKEERELGGGVPYDHESRENARRMRYGERGGGGQLLALL